MSQSNNTEILEDLQSDFDGFLAAKDWKNARAAIDSLYEQGFEHEGMILAKALARAQYEAVEPMPMDERDLADRDYPRE